MLYIDEKSLDWSTASNTGNYFSHRMIYIVKKSYCNNTSRNHFVRNTGSMGPHSKYKGLPKSMGSGALLEGQDYLLWQWVLSNAQQLYGKTVPGSQSSKYMPIYFAAVKPTRPSVSKILNFSYEQLK